MTDLTDLASAVHDWREHRDDDTAPEAYDAVQAVLEAAEDLIETESARELHRGGVR